MVANKKSAKRRKPLVVTLTIIGSVIFLGFGIFFSVKAYDHYETYRDRPLAEGYEYVGRDYTSNCFINFIKIHSLCFIAETDRYYYTTDSDPADLIKTAPKWAMGSNGESKRSVWNDPNTFTKAHYYNADNIQSGEHIYYEALYDTKAVTKASNLKPSDKRYIVSIDRQYYEKLVGKKGN